MTRSDIDQNIMLLVTKNKQMKARLWPLAYKAITIWFIWAWVLFFKLMIFMLFV